MAKYEYLYIFHEKNETFLRINKKNHFDWGKSVSHIGAWIIVHANIHTRIFWSFTIVKMQIQYIEIYSMQALHPPQDEKLCKIWQEKRERK